MYQGCGELGRVWSGASVGLVWQDQATSARSDRWVMLKHRKGTVCQVQ